MRIRAVIFDLGGVVVEWNDDIAYRKAAKIAKAPFRKLKRIADEELMVLARGSITETEFWRRILKRVKTQKNHILQKLDGMYYGEYRKKSRLNRKIVGIIRKLRAKYRLGVISNISIVHDSVNRKRSYYKYFRHEILSYKVKLTKPDIRIYRLAARRMRCKPQECLFIDDKLVNVEGARRAGMNAVHYRNITQLKKDLRKYGIAG